MAIISFRTPDGLWLAFDDEEDPTPEHAYDSPRRTTGVGDFRQEAVDDLMEQLGHPYSMNVEEVA